MNFEEIKRQCKNEWVLVEVLKEDEKGKIVDARLIAHSKKREDVYNKLKNTKKMYTFHFYNGEIPKGYAFAL